jgi:hypothetical protein
MSLRSISPTPRRASLYAVASVAAVLGPGPALAVNAIDLSVRDIRSTEWSASGISLSIQLDAAGRTTARARIERAKFAQPLGELRAIEIICPAPIVREPIVSCPDARVRAAHSRFGRLAFVAAASFDRASQSLAVKARGLRLAGQEWRVTANWRPKGWQVALAADRVHIGELRKLLAFAISLPADIEIDGSVSPRLTITGRDSVGHMAIDADVQQMSLNNADGTLATDKLALKIDVALTPTRRGYDFESHVALTGGQAYRDPVFIDVGRAPVTVDLAGTWESAGERLLLSRYEIDQAGVLRAAGAAELTPFATTTVRSLHVALEQAMFPGLYTTYLQPFLVNGDFKNLATRGTVRGTAQFRDDSPVALDLELEAIDVDDATGHMAMHGLGGHVSWNADLQSQQPSRISWRDSKIYGFAGGAASVSFLAAGRTFRMLEPTRLPVFDGGVAIAALELRDVGLSTMSVAFDANIEPISMRPICAVLGWPEFSGTVAGRIPRLTFKNKLLTLDGDLEARVFDGRMVVGKLRLQDPLGTWPRLWGDIELENLDLESVTGTFSFGEITGRLSGYVRGLELFGWQPVAFDAVLATPPDDSSEHRISQRAISNISAIGGGSGGSATAALSSGFLRFFEHFKYDRLGLACKLENDVCLMRGIAPARDGYYIVRGRGLPRIDVIGSAGRIDWPQLVANLKAATAAGPPTVKETK